MNMDRAIFDMNLGIEATSAYILICSILDQGRSPTIRTMRTMWTQNEDSLRTAVAVLIERGILDHGGVPSDDVPLKVTAPDKWQWG